MLLEVNDLQVKYGSVEAVCGVSFRVEEGEMVVIVGSNGAGKSTILKTISGLLKPTRGTIRFAGKDIQGQSAHSIVGAGIAQAEEGHRIFQRQSVYDNLLLGAYSRRNKKEIGEDMERMYTIFPILKTKRGNVAVSLSGGEQQMLSIAQCLMSRPKLLMLDEPSLGLAPILVEKIFGVVRELNAGGTTVLLVEQMVQQALALCHRGYVLETGRVVLEGSASDLRDNPLIQEVYLGH
ncbi:MAG: ABC transporter ATP-binding protein [Dehalococcoidia bacterium]|nr:ABC transporter ATP-binding protein [Dehalococcoidia bacterium]